VGSIQTVSFSLSLYIYIYIYIDITKVVYRLYASDKRLMVYTILILITTDNNLAREADGYILNKFVTCSL